MSCCPNTGRSCPDAEFRQGVAPAPCILHTMDTSERNASQAYYAQIQIPDRVGVFKLRVSYIRPGFAPLIIEKTVVVRHFSHHEYPRMTPASFPYYIVMISLLFSGLIFAAIFLYFREDGHAPSLARTEERPPKAPTEGKTSQLVPMAVPHE
jgi:hypothetical protein